jgi:hypothetical protein
MKLNIPKTLTSGDRIIWRDRFNDYLPTTHNLTWAIRGAVSVDAMSVADGEEFLTIIDNAASSTLTAGNYYWQANITEIATGYRNTLGNGSLEVIVDLAGVSGAYDGRSENEKLLDAVNQAITAYANGGLVQSYSIKGRSLSRYSLDELMKMRDRLSSQVERERAFKDGKDGRKAYVRFDRPS